MATLSRAVSAVARLPAGTSAKSTASSEVGARSRHVEAVSQDLTSRGAPQPETTPEEGRLASLVRTDPADSLALSDFEGDADQADRPAKAHSDLTHLLRTPEHPLQRPPAAARV